jgi:hypothetical protein
MINYEQTDSGGSVRVNCGEGICLLTYNLSNKTTPLSMQCSVGNGSTPDLVAAVVSSLLEKHEPTVLLMKSKDTAVRFRPKAGDLFRCWTQGDQTVYAEAFASRKLLERVCSLSYAMQNCDFVRVEDDEIKLFGYYDVVKRLRENSTPFEFLSLKEECDYSMRTCAAGCLRTLAESAKAHLYTIPQRDRGAFTEVTKELITKQQQESFRFDTKYSYIQEAVVGIVLPALVKYGTTHPFTAAVFTEFSKQASVYTESSEKFLNDCREILNGKSEPSDDDTTY